MHPNNDIPQSDIPKIPQQTNPSQNQQMPYFPMYFYSQYPIPQNNPQTWTMPDPRQFMMPPPYQPFQTSHQLPQKVPEKKEESEDQEKSMKTKVLACRCTKSNCRKQYCFCYKNGVSCNEKCICVNCRNTQDSLNIKHDFKKISSVTCNCMKSKCQKKYCECFASGRKCGEHCNCKECKNC